MSNSVGGSVIGMVASELVFRFFIVPVSRGNRIGRDTRRKQRRGRGDNNINR